MEVVFDRPVGPDDLAEALGGQSRADEIIGCFHGGFSPGLAGPDDFADGLEPRPVMVFLEPADRGGDGGGTGFDAAMAGIDGGMDGDRRDRRGMC